MYLKVFCPFIKVNKQIPYFTGNWGGKADTKMNMVYQLEKIPVADFETSHKLQDHMDCTSDFQKVVGG